MGLFNNLTEDGLEETQDRLGGRQLFDTDVYEATVKMFYAGKADSGAQNVTVVLDLDGKEYSETVYVTNKKGENWFPNKSDPTKKVPLPGFTLINDMCLVTVGKSLSEMVDEEKVIKVYNFETRQEEPKAVPMFTEILGEKLGMAIIKQIVNKQAKNSAGEYVDTNDTKEENVMEKAFNLPTRMTVVEARNGATEATFWDSWAEKNKGVTRDKTNKSNAGGSAGAPPKSGETAGKARKSLFGGN